MRGKYTIGNQTWKVVGGVALIKPITAASGNIELFFRSGGKIVNFSSFAIRNLGQFPMRIEGKKTLMPFEVWQLGMDDIRELKDQTFAYSYIENVNGTAITAVSNLPAGYDQQYVIEGEGIIIEECECESNC